MAELRKITVTKPELLKLTSLDLTVLDLALSTAIGSWVKNGEKGPVSRGPFASTQQFSAAQELLEQVLLIKTTGVYDENLDED